MNRKPLVIGIGNEFREDDAFGIIVVKEVRSQYPDLAEYTLKTDLGTLVEQFQDRDLVVVDAIRTEQVKAGSIFEAHSMDELLMDEEIIYSTHGLGIAETLKLALLLDKRPSSFYFIGAEVGHWQMGESMTTALHEQIPEVVKKVIDWINSL